jgi:hypothetical protein
MWNRRWLLPLLLSLPLAAVVLFLGACLPVGVGDPETSKVDQRLAGVWVEAEKEGTEGNFVVLLPFDGRAYVMRVVEADRTEEGIDLKPGEAIYKAWLTTIEGRTFLTAQPLYPREALGDEKPPGFLVAQLKLSEDGSSVEARGVNTDFEALAPLKSLPGHIKYDAPEEGTKPLSEADAKALLRKVIASNLDNEKLFTELSRYKRVTDKAVLKALFESLIPQSWK